MPLIDNLNELIDDSMSFPFYNNLIHYLIWYPPLYQLVEAFLRARVPPGRRAPARARKKCFDQLIKGREKGQIQWISNQIINAIVGKGENPLTIHSNDWD